jgi:hypothetical protein
MLFQDWEIHGRETGCLAQSAAPGDDGIGMYAIFSEEMNQ